MNRSKSLIAFTLALTLMLAGAPVSAMMVAGVKFESQKRVHDQELELRGAGILKYMVFIKAYAGALYLPEDVPSELALSDVPKMLEVEYFHALKGKDFGPATIEGMSKNVDEETMNALQEQIALHNSLYVDVEPGDRYSLYYTPGHGTVLALNGKPMGTIKGADFAAALFSIWLGPNPADAKFKTALLGQP
jgi:hypothetical protein